MPPGKLFTPFSTPPYLRSRHLKVCANLAREEVFHLAVAWNRRRLPAESDGPLNGETFITRTFSSLFYLFSIRYRHRPPNPRTPSSILKVGTGRAYPGAPVPILWSHHVHSASNRSKPPSRPKIHRSPFCHRQSHFLHERPQNRHPRRIPRPPLRRPRRSRSTHRRLLPPPPTHHPRCPRPRRRPHLLRVDSPPPPRRRNPSLAISERQQVQRPTEVP